MKVASVEVFRVDMPMRGFFRNAFHNHDVQPCCLVRLRTDDGFEGVGDAEPFKGYSSGGRDETAEAIERRLGPALLGADPRRARAAARLMDEAAEGLYEAKAALAMALADLHARALGVPLHELLGGAVVEEVFFNGWIGILGPEEAAREASAYKKRGWISAKVKAGGDVEADAARVLAVREAAGRDFEIRIDANESYARVEDAVAFAREVRGAAPSLFEQPVPRADLEGMARIRRAIGFPVMADECVYGHESLLRIIRAGAADIVKLKILKQGGLLPAREMAATAEAAGLKLVIGHGFGLTAYTLAEIHLAATSAAFLRAIESVGPDKMRDDVVDRPLDIGAGRLAVPREPGLGVRLDEEKLDLYRAKGAALV
ncbi:MAG: dipeptide epimerase [Candidatus Tectomicrobia bacterium]|uniref:Dipeptide epimerase n=1 Tax=Tectimicrobiota bacterium TaxID=2528274 RepID=A0A932MME1_UNCTE|nr:dipeptide epimerase [Candidatus Tectomicrobia bacterium]